MDETSRTVSGSRLWLVLAPALAIVFLSSLDLTVIAPILPLILIDLQINAAEADRYVWIASGYLIAYTSFIPLFGRLSDSIGRYPSLVIAAALFAGGSVICATADSLGILVLGRVIQGAGGGAMLPVTMALVADTYPDSGRARMLGVVGAIETIGWVLGPMWGSLIEQVGGSWRWVFWVNLPTAVVIATAMIARWRARVPGRESRPSIDLVSAALAIAGLSTLTLGLSIAETTGLTEGPRALGAQPHPLDGFRLIFVVVGALLLIGFGFRQTRVKNPLLPLELFRFREFAAATFANFGMGIALMVTLVNVPVTAAVLVRADRLSIVTAQLLAAFSLPMAVSALAGGWMIARTGRAIPAFFGFAFGAGGYFLMSRWPYEIDFQAMMPGLLVAGLGLGLVVAPLADAALSVTGVATRGIGASIVIVSRLLGMTIGISILSAWAASTVDSRLRAIDVPAQTGAETTAEYLARQESYLIDQAIPITLDILQTTFLVAGIVCVIALVPSLLIGLRNRSTSGMRTALDPDSDSDGSGVSQ